MDYFNVCPRCYEQGKIAIPLVRKELGGLLECKKCGVIPADEVVANDIRLTISKVQDR